MMVGRKVRVRPAAVIGRRRVFRHGQRAEIERLLVGGRGRCGGGNVARRRPPSGRDQAADPVVLLQDHRGRGRRGRRRRFVRRRRVVVVIVFATVVVVVVQVVELVQVPVELVAGRVDELVPEQFGFVVADPAVRGAGGRGQPEPFSAGHRG